MAKKKVPKEVREYFSEIGKRASREDRVKAGKARAAKLTPERRSEIAKKAVAAREAKRKR